MSTFNNRVAIVTGGNSGIGYATAKALKAEGAKVIITGRRKEAIEKAAEELGVTGIVADQSSLVATAQLVAQVSKDFGKVDVLFINAGVAHMLPIAQVTEDHYDEIMNINLKGAYFTLNKFIPILNEGAAVVFLSSNTASFTNAGASVYAASKAALNSVMRTAALELAPQKITVNSVSPGPTQTEILNKSGHDAATLESLHAWMIERLPMKRLGTAEEVAKLVLHVAGDAGRFITGSDFVIDGGMIIA